MQIKFGSLFTQVSLSHPLLILNQVSFIFHNFLLASTKELRDIGVQLSEGLLYIFTLKIL